MREAEFNYPMSEDRQYRLIKKNTIVYYIHRPSGVMHRGRYLGRTRVFAGFEEVWAYKFGGYGRKKPEIVPCYHVELESFTRENYKGKRK